MRNDLEHMAFHQRRILSGMAFEAYDVLDVDTVQYWRVVIPGDISVFLYSREIAGDEGPIFYEIYPDAVVDTVGDPIHTENRRKGGPESSVQINRCTLTSAGDGIIKAIARGRGGGVGVRIPGNAEPAIEEIYMPNTTIVVGCRVDAPITNVELRYDWIIGEPLEAIDA